MGRGIKTTLPEGGEWALRTLQKLARCGRSADGGPETILQLFPIRTIIFVIVFRAGLVQGAPAS